MLTKFVRASQIKIFWAKTFQTSVPKSYDLPSLFDLLNVNVDDDNEKQSSHKYMLLGVDKMVIGSF